MGLLNRSVKVKSVKTGHTKNNNAPYTKMEVSCSRKDKDGAVKYEMYDIFCFGNLDVEEDQYIAIRNIVDIEKQTSLTKHGNLKATVTVFLDESCIDLCPPPPQGNNAYQKPKRGKDKPVKPEDDEDCSLPLQEEKGVVHNAQDDFMPF